MKINSVLNRFILKELIPPFVINLVFFMFVFLMSEILDITDMIVNYQVSMGAFFLMILYSMPYFLVYVIPMSVMMSILLVFLRMSADNEIIALKAGGISLYSMIPPVLIFAVCGFVVASGMAAWAMPWGRSAYEQMALDVVKSNFNIGMSQGNFNDSFEGLMFYVSEVDMETRELKNVFIEDSRQSGTSSTVVAPKGNLVQGKDPYIFMVRLYDGMISQVEIEKHSAHAIYFDTYDLRIDLSDAAASTASRRKDEKEMNISELCNFLRTSDTKDSRYYSVLIELHKKFSIPFACLSLGILAMPLGVISVSGRKSAGLGLGLFCFLLYYLLLSAGTVVGETGRFHPALGLWMPNVIMGCLGVYFMIKTARDQQVPLISVPGAAIARMAQLFHKGQIP